MDGWNVENAFCRILACMWNEIAVLAERNNGVILRRDLLSLGCDYDGTRAFLKRLYRVSRGVYSLTKPSGPEQVHELRTVAALRRYPNHAASHVSAAILHGLPIFRADLTVIHLHSNIGGRRGKRGSTHVHHGERVHVMASTGLVMTSVADTLVDCARSQSRETAVVMADFALHNRMVTQDEIEEALHRAQFRAGASKARMALALADARSESVGKTRARLICHDAGIAVTPQVEVRDGQGNVLARFDLMLDGYPIGLAFDGRGKYTRYRDPDAPADQKFWEEKLQQELVEDHGYQRVPVHWALLDHPDQVVARLQRAIARALRMAG